MPSTTSTTPCTTESEGRILEEFMLTLKRLANRRNETPQAGRHLRDLPLDVLLLIIGCLDVEGLLVCKQVCRLFSELVESDVYLQYKLELGINGLIEGPASAQLPVFERIAKLRERSARVCSADFSSAIDYELGRQPDSEIEQSVLPVWNPSSGNAVSYRLLGGRKGTSALVVHSPCCSLEGLEARRWTRSIPHGRDVIAIDVSQDLVVLQETTGQVGAGSNSIHLLSLEQWPAAHPKATQKVLEVFPQTTLQADQLHDFVDSSLSVTDTRICGRYVAWNTLCQDDRETNSLEVWDWYLGCRVWHGHFHRYTSYTFLDSEYLVVIDYEHEHELLVYHFANSQSHVPCIPSANPTARPGNALRFKLPWGSHWCNIRDSCAPPSSTPPSSTMFWPDPDQRIIALNLSITRTGDSTDAWFMHCPCILLIPRATIRKHLEVQASKNSWTSSSLIKWETWGPHGSLLLQNTRIQTHQWDSYQPIEYHPFGSRISMLEEHDGGVRLVTYDLNPYARMHRPHEGCCKYDKGRSKLEDFSAYRPEYRLTNRTALETSMPRTVYIGPLLDDIDRPYMMFTNKNGFTVVCKNEFHRYYITGFQTFHL